MSFSRILLTCFAVFLHFVVHVLILLHQTIIFSALTGWRLSVLINDTLCYVISETRIKLSGSSSGWICLQKSGIICCSGRISKTGIRYIPMVLCPDRDWGGADLFPVSEDLGSAQFQPPNAARYAMMLSA